MKTDGLPEKPGILDVARAAGVSTASVSNFLNGRYGEMRADTRQRIADAVEALGYVRNIAARQLKTGHAPIIALLVPSVANPYFGELAVAVDAEAQRHGFHMILCNTQRNPGHELSVVQELVDGGVHGIISALAFNENITHMERFIQRGAAFVFLENSDHALAHHYADIVSIDQERPTAMAVAHLAEQGHSAIAYVSLSELTDNRIARLDGYKKAMSQRGLPHRIITDHGLPSREIPYSDASLAHFGQMVVARLCHDAQPMPTGIICMNDLTAFGVMFGLREAGLKIPDDVSVIGIDGIALSQFTVPPLCTSRQPYDLLARTAIEKIRASLDDRTRGKDRTLLEPQLLQRASVGRCRPS